MANMIFLTLIEWRDQFSSSSSIIFNTFCNLWYCADPIYMLYRHRIQQLLIILIYGS